MVSSKYLAKEARKSKTSKQAKKPSKPDPKSSEFVPGSEDEVPSKSESNGDHGSIDSKQQVITLETNGRLPAPDESSSESGSESDQETTSSEEEDEDLNTIVNKVPLLPESQKGAISKAVTSSMSFQPSPYKPPSGFEIESLDGNLMASEILSNRNLAGKQIWYFTAPASIDISALEEISVLDMKEGKPLFKHKGDEYKFVMETKMNQTFTNIMVPNNLDKGYQITSKPIDQILHLQQQVDLPGMNSSKANKDSLLKKAPRPQPKGLRMRFHPIGFDTENPETIGSSSTDGDSDSSDEHMGAASKVFQRPESPRTYVDFAEIDKSISDGERNDIPMIPSKFTSKNQPETLGKTKISSQDSQSSKKRKHEDGKGKKHKKRLSSPASKISMRGLTGMKKK